MKKNYSKIKIITNLLVGICFLFSIELNGQAPVSQTFAFTGSLQTFTVPSGVSSISITAAGAQGIGANGYLPGNGGIAFGVLTVTQGQILNIYVGGTNAYNGGGVGLGGANGGGASDVRVGGTAIANRVIVAGGGGGAGGDNWGCITSSGHGGGGTAVSTNFVGGAGGSGYSFCGANGGNSGGTAGSATHGGGGGGGGLISGGSGAASSIGTAVSGSLGQGGASYNSSSCGATGGGGGGYYGGGGAAGNNCGAGRGGGGSSWTGTLSSPSFTAGTRTGNGLLIISYSFGATNTSGPLVSGSSALTFSFTGSTQSYTVPSCVNSITFNVQGAKGGAGTPITSSGGNGGGVSGIMTVTPGQVLQINVGGIGTVGSISSFAAGGYNGGGAGGLFSGNYGGGGGGGASDIRVSPYALANRFVVAGGGGGGAYNSSTTDFDRGGRGGTTTGEAGFSNNVSGGTAPGGGGSPSSGGGAGFWSGYCTATAGSLGNGGPGGTCTNSGGGGGGGYYGGGGGVWAGGGGGSNYVDPSITGVVHSQGINNLSGIVSFTIGVNGNLVNNIVASPSVICAGNTVTLSTSGLISYTWTSVSGSISSTSSVAVTPTVSSNYTVLATNSVGCVSGYSIFVFANSLPTISVNSATICSGSIFTMIPSGAATYTYAGGSNTVAPMSNNIYTVTGTSSLGCVAATSAISSVTVVTLPIISAASGTICTGNTYTIVPSGASTYTYSGGSSLVSPISNTNYSVSGTSSAGCVSLPTALTVSVAPLPIISVNSGGFCSGKVFTITPSGASIYTINIGGSGTSFTVSPASNTNYLITGASSVGCVGSSGALSSVTVYATPTVAVSSGSICSNNSYSMIVSGASTYTYSSGSATVNPVTTSSYSVTGTSSLGCESGNTAVSTVTVYITPTLVVNSGPICIGQTFTMTPFGASTYSYSNGSATVSPIISSSYSVTGTSIQGCASFNTAVSSVTVNATPTISVNSGTLCSGNIFTIIPSGAFSYSVSGGSTTVTPIANAIYLVTGTSAQGCAGTNTAISTVTVYSTPIISVNSGSICSGQPFVILPTGATTYSISGGSATVMPTSNTNYIVTGTNSVGCISAQSAISSITVYSLPIVSIVNSKMIICIGETASLSALGASTYSWTNGLINSSIIITPSITTSYTVVGTTTNGCSSSAAVSQIVDACTAIDKQNKSQEVGITVFPNPNNGSFEISLLDVADVNVEIYTVLGQRIVLLNNLSNTTAVSLNNYDNGVYILRIIKQNKVIGTHKIIKQ
jgi:hypothetical protein